MKVIITKEIDKTWAMPEELAEMTDEEVVELLMEDTPALLENAQWEIAR